MAPGSRILLAVLHPCQVAVPDMALRRSRSRSAALRCRGREQGRRPPASHARREKRAKFDALRVKLAPAAGAAAGTGRNDGSFATGRAFHNARHYSAAEPSNRPRMRPFAVACVSTTVGTGRKAQKAGSVASASAWAVDRGGMQPVAPGAPVRRGGPGSPYRAARRFQGDHRTGCRYFSRKLRRPQGSKALRAPGRVAAAIIRVRPAPRHSRSRTPTSAPAGPVRRVSALARPRPAAPSFPPRSSRRRQGPGSRSSPFCFGQPGHDGRQAGGRSRSPIRRATGRCWAALRGGGVVSA